MRAIPFNEQICFSFRLMMLCALLLPNPAPAQEHTTLRLGTVSSKASKHINYGMPLVQYLAAQSGLRGGEVVVAGDIEQMALWLRTGKVDLVSETVFAALQLRALSDAEFLLRRWKKGVANYASVFISKQSSGINTLDDLRNKRIVFEDRTSTSGYFIPAAMLIEAGLKLSHIASPSSPVPANHVGVLFANEQLNTSSEINITAWVYQGQADAGAYSDLDWNSPTSAPTQLKKKLTVFAQSPSFPRSIMLIRASLATNMKNALKQALMHADRHDEGRKALHTYQRTKRFDELDSAAWQAIERADAMRKIVVATL